MSTDSNRMATILQTTTFNKKFVSPSHEQFIPTRMKKANLFVRSLGVLAIILSTFTASYAQIGWCNLQSPGSGSINYGGTLTIYGRVYINGVTTLSGQQPGISAEIGYSTADTDPSTWVNWSAAAFNAEYGNDDEYMGTFSGLAPGTYYYAFRFSDDAGANWSYGGYTAGGGNFWGTGGAVNGSLTVTAVPPTITSFSPTSGAVGATVTITGTGFDVTPANNVVYFGGLQATVTAATSTQLTVAVPVGANSSHIEVTNLATGRVCISPSMFILNYSGTSTFVSNSYGTNFTMGASFRKSSGEAFEIMDVNSDGKPDIIYQALNGTDCELRVLYNNSTTTSQITAADFNDVLLNSWAAGTQYASGPILAGDYNADGLLDIHCSSVGYNGTAMLRQDGSSPGTFIYGTTGASSYQSGPRLIDFSNDGLIDIVSTYFHPSINFYQQTNTSNPTAAPPVITSSNAVSNLGGSAARGTFVSDFDKDGYDDPAIYSTDLGQIVVKPNNGGGYGANVTLNCQANYDMISADLDNDGYVEIISGGSTALQVFENTSSVGSISFSTATDVSIGLSSQIYALDVLDINNDGLLDLIVLTSGKIILLTNNSTGDGDISFEAPIQLSTGSGNNSYDLSILDINNDGILEIITRGTTFKVFTYTQLQSVTANPTTLNGFQSCVGLSSNELTTVVSGSDLTGNMVITAPSGFEISLTSGTGFVSSLTLTPSAGTVPSTTIFVRLASSASAGVYSSNLTIVSPGTSENVALSGTVYAYPTLVITDPAVQCTVGGTVDITDAAVTAGSTPAGLTFTYFSDALATTTLASPSAVASSGTYYIVGSNNGCTDTASVDVTILTTAMSAVTLAVDDKPCGSTATGSMTVTITDGVGPFTYAWTRNGTAYTATPSDAPTNLLPGTYVVTVTDACGTVVASSGLNLTTAPSLSIVGTPAQNGTIICSGATTGSITGVIQGGTSPRTLSVTNTGTNTSYTSSVPTGSPAAGQYSFEVTGLPAGTYTVEAYDGVSSCNDTWNGTITISEPNAISINNTILDACYGQTNGSITVSASGGTGTLEYSIDNTTYQASNQFTSLSANTYTVYVQDANNCVDSATAVVGQPNVALSVSATATTNVNCFGQSTGAVTVQGAGGDGTYTFSINGTTFAASATFTGLAAGTYTITVKDGSNCTETVDVTITQPAAALSATTSVVDVLCFGQSTGEATVTPAGGTAPYTYAWSGSQTTATITGQAAGTYTVTVTDANLCTTTASATIATSPAITLTATATDITCNGDGDGTVTAVAGGGASPYTYLWNDASAQSTATATGLQAGTYQVTLTDNNGCVRTSTATVVEPTQIAASVGTPTDVLCFGGATGSVTASATGGTVAGAYSFSWNDANTQTTATASNLLAGNYTVTVEDDNGCQATASATIAQPASAVDLASSGIVNVNCFGGQTGEFVVTATGGTSPYDISMTAPSTSTITAATETYSNLLANTYEVSVEDANGCIDTVMVTITQGTQVTYTTVVADACNPSNDGSITFTAAGGTGSYSYSIDNGSTWSATAAFTGLAAGVYDILVRDSYNCTTAANTDTVYTASSQLAVSIVETTSATCYQVDDAVLTSIVTGGQSTYTYVWSDNSTSANISAGTQGSAYSVVVTDSYGCTATSNTITTTTITDMVPTTSVSNVTCNGTSDGSIDLSSISGGSSASYNYSWDGTNYTAFTGSTVTNGSLSAGSYTLYIQDQTNTSCVSQTTLTVTEPAVLAGTVVATDVTCFGSNDGTITITGATGGSGSYEYSIDGGTTWQSGNTFTGLSNATYDVQIRDAGVVTCIIDLDGASNTVIAQPTALTASISAQTNNLCNGDTDGTATVTAAGGTAPYSYSWTGGATTAAISSLAAGAYTVTVTDANSCTVSATATITEPSLLEIYDDGISDASCSNTTDGAIPVSAFGGTSPYTYAWTGPNGFTSTQEDQWYNLAPGTYSVTVTDANGCTATASNLVVGSPTAVTLTATSTDLTCFESNDGTATVTYSGGTSPYGFAWTFNGAAFATAQNLTGLAAGDYEVTITDGNFCQFTSSTLTITQPAQLTATVSAATPVCSGEDAVFTITGTAGEVVTYTINGGTSATATIGVSGTVDVTIAAVSADQAFAMVSVSDGTCTNAYTGTATVVVNTLPTASAGADQSVCDGTDVTLAGTGGVSYAWDNGVTDNVAFTVTNNTNAPVTTTYTLTITDANGCTATNQVDVTVNPTPTVDAIADQTVCANTGTTAVAFTSAFGVTGTTYPWTNDNTTIGLAASATGDIPSFTAANTTTTTQVATITVIPTAATCTGTAETFTISVLPTPTVNQQANITYCGGVQQPDIVFTGTTTNTQYAWTSSQNVGFFSSGIATPTIGSYVIDPLTQVVSNVVVTPQIVSGALTCSGTNMVFTVTVDPTPSVNAVADQSLCTGASTAAINFTGTVAGATYNWTNDNTTIGLAASGAGNIASFTATNSGTSTQVANITVTPVLGACTGASTSTTITVYPTPTVTAPSNQVICAGDASAEVSLSGAVSGTLYAWANDNTAIGLAANGYGTIPAFTTVNAGTTAATATVTVTPYIVPTAGTAFATYQEGQTFTLTAPSGMVFTSVQFASYGNSTGTGPNFVVGSENAANSVAAMEQAALGNNTFSIAATDANFPNNFGGSQTLSAVLTYGVLANACPGTPQSFTYTVNPVPVYANQTASTCSGTVLSVTPTGTTVPAGTQFTWTVVDNPDVTGEAANATAASTFSANLVNTSNTAQTVVYTLTPIAGTCAGATFTMTVTVDPTPSVTAQTATICSATSFSVTPANGSGNIVPSGTTYSWSAPTVTGITGAASGTNAASISGTLVNTTNAPIDVTYTVTPTAGSCTGATFTVTVTVDPVPAIANTTEAICSGATFTTTPSNGTDIVPTGTTYTWTVATNANVTGQSAQATAQSSISQTLVNTTNSVEQVVYTVTPTAGSCAASTFTITTTVNPTPSVTAQSATICSGAAFTVAPANGSGNVVPAGTQYTWTVAANANVTGEADQATAQNNISQTLTNTTGLVETVVYTVTPEISGCTGAPFTVTVTVNPTPSIANTTMNACSGEVFALTPASGNGDVVPAGTTYTWTVADNSFVLGESDEATAQTSISQTLANNYVTAQNVVYTITPTAGTCSGATFTLTLTVYPNPTVAALTGATTVCEGSTTTMASATTGGTWSTSDATVATVSSAGVVTGVAAGTATITYTVTDANGCTGTATASVTVNTAATATITAGGATTFCDGGSVTLTASAGSSYAWSNGAQTQAITVTAGGSYYVTVTNASGCASTSAATSVTVNAAPTVAALTGATTVCEGSTTTMACATTGGVWTTSDATIASVDANGTVTGVAAGSATITYTVTDANGCTGSASAAVTVNAATAGTISANGSTTFCAGGSVTLTASAGSSYAWSNGAQTQSIDVTTSGTYYVNVGNASGCTTTSSAVVVTVNAAPTVAALTGATIVCEGATIMMASATTGGVWSTSDATIATVDANGTVTGVAAGSATITYTVTDANGCTGSASAAVTVNAATAGTISANGTTTFCSGGAVTLTASAGSSYAWSNGAQTQSIDVTTSGSYYVTVTNASGCSSTTSAVVVTVNPTPIASISSTGSTACLGSTVTLTAAGGANYAWSTGETTQSINVTSSDNYQVTVTSAEGCTATATESVLFNANPAVTVSANGPTVFCQGGSLTLTATGGTTYVWSNGDQGATTSVSQSGNYFVTVTNAAGCTTQSSVVAVVVNATPVVAAISGANAVCEGGTINLSSSTNGGIWTSANNFIATIDASGAVTGLNAGTTTMTYTVTSGGCSASVSAQVTVMNNPVTPSITASGATSVCPGSTVVLFASNAANYQWSTGATTPFIVVSQSGDYTVTAVGTNGCSATSTPITVFIGDDTAPTISAPLNVTTSPNLGCEAIGVSLGTPVTSDNCGVASVTNDAPAIFPIGTTIVTWTVTDASGNTATATQVVTVVDQSAPVVTSAPADITVSTNDFCEATGVQLGMPMATDNCTNDLTITNNAPATYPLGTTTVTWTITDASGNSTTVDQTVTVVDQTAPVVLLANTSVILDANGSATINFADVDNGSYDNCGIASVILGQSDFDCSNVGNNLITVTVIDNSGNQSTAQVMVTVIASDACGNSAAGPSIPDAFTPNGNNFNDTWVIPGLEGYNTKEMTVYSRYGTQVYYSSQYANDWDGTLLNTGTPVPDGTYYYILKLDGGKQISGYVYINRVKQ